MLKMLFVMDPIESINIGKDTTFVIMLECQARGHYVYYCETANLFTRNSEGWTDATPIRLQRKSDYYAKFPTQSCPLDHFDVIWMRKDPPFNTDYIYSTYILNRVDERTTHVINHPAGIRESNEKMYALNFAKYMPPTLVSKDIGKLKEFLKESGGEIVIKPLDGYGGEGIFLVKQDDPNLNVIIESSTSFGQTYVMAQKFIAQVSKGDKRVIILNGEPLGAVMRVATKGEFRSNFHSGGHPEKTELTERDLEICNALRKKLLDDRLYLVGIDIVGGFLTEVNTTSPTCVQEINFFSKTKLESQIVNFAEQLVQWGVAPPS